MTQHARHSGGIHINVSFGAAGAQLTAHGFGADSAGDQLRDAGRRDASRGLSAPVPEEVNAGLEANRRIIDGLRQGGVFQQSNGVAWTRMGDSIGYKVLPKGQSHSTSPEPWTDIATGQAIAERPAPRASMLTLAAATPADSIDQNAPYEVRARAAVIKHREALPAFVQEIATELANDRNSDSRQTKIIEAARKHFGGILRGVSPADGGLNLGEITSKDIDTACASYGLKLSHKELMCAAVASRTLARYPESTTDYVKQKAALVARGKNVWG